MIRRKIASNICGHIGKNKAILLFGARQVGKTTLLENLNCLPEEKTLYFNGDESDIRELFANPTSVRLKHTFTGYSYVIIDEAQGISNIGLVLKIIIDKIKDVQVIATGSSAFELANKSNEPLTGRKFEFKLFPLSFSEMVYHSDFLTEFRNLELRLIYGYYPEVINNPGDEKKRLKLIAGSYLYKDLLQLDNIRRSELIEKILKALALQIGSEVIYSEIAQLCQTNVQTVERYIDIFEKTYIIFKLPALSKNVRNEIKKGKKIYFWDVGIRNAIINSFETNIALRTDLGALWENYLISERMKQHHYNQNDVECYFWRTTQQQEIDFIEEYNDGYMVYEFKWNKKSKLKISKTFTESYHVKKAMLVTPDNIETFLLEDDG